MMCKRRPRVFCTFVLLLVTVASTVAQQAEENSDPFQFPALTRRKAFQRGYWDLKQRAYPSGDIPQSSRNDALRQISQANSAPVQGNTWVSIGPAPMRDGQTAPPMPVSGRVSDVVADPRDANRWLLGGAQGGIWETRDAGVTWIPLTDNQASLAVGTIAFAPSNPDIIYVGTGESVFSGDAYGGAGLLKSTNNGVTWQLLAATNFAKNCFSEIKVDPSNPDIVVASVCSGTAGRGGSNVPLRPARGIYRSTDGGVTWSLQLRGEGTDLEVDSSNFNNQFAALGQTFGSNSNGVYRSTDGGINWARLAEPWTSLPGGVGRIEMAIASDNPNVLCLAIQDGFNLSPFDGALLGVWRTDDALAAAPVWNTLPSPDPSIVRDQCWYDLDLILDPANSSVLYLGEVALWKYDGNAWSAVAGDYDSQTRGKLVHPDQQAMAWVGNRLLLGNDGGLWSSADGGASWNDHNTTLALTQFYDGSIHPANINFAIAGCQDNGTALWTGSNSWQWILGGDGCDNAISRTRPDTDWAVSSQFLNIIRTTDGGGNAIVADFGIDKFNAPFIARFEKSPNNDNVFIAGTDNLWRCNDFFSAVLPRWVSNGPEMGAEITALAFAPSDTTSSTYAFGTQFGDLRLTTNGGATWINLDIGNKVPDRYVTDLAFDPSNASVLAVTLSGFDEGTPGQPGHLFRTVNAFSPNIVWANISPPVNLPHNTLVFDPFDSSIIYVGTDIGIWKTADDAFSWGHMGPASGLPNVAVFELQITHNPDNLVAFTHGRGAFALRRSSTNVTDLVLALSDSPDPVTIGQALTYRAIIANQGPSAANNVTLTDVLPTGVNFVAATASQGACNLSGRRVSCDLGSMPVGAFATVDILVSPSVAGQVVNSATVSSDEIESVQSNNSATVLTTAASPAADLILTGVDFPDPVEAGRELTYRLALTNAGPAVARSVVLNDLLPARVNFISAVSSQGACGFASGTVTCAVGTLQPGAGASFVITVRPVVPGQVTNRVSVSASISDPNPANNALLLVTSIRPPAPVMVAAGSRLVAETILNGGLDSNENVTVTFNLKNIGSLPTTDLVARLEPGAGVLAPSPQQSYGSIPQDGSVVGRSFSFTTAPTPDGIVNATLQLVDGTNDLGRITYRFALTQFSSWANAGGIILPDSGPGSLFPSPIFVSGVEGSVRKASVTLFGVSHTYPLDMDALLVSPGGQKVMLLSDAGGGNPVSGVRLTLDDFAPGLVSPSSLVTGSFRPTDYESGDTLPAPAPAGPFATTLQSVSGVNPNGTWRLYVADDATGDEGRIAGGWELKLESIDPVDPEADVSVRITDLPDPTMLGSNVTYSIVVSNAGPDTAEAVILTSTLSSLSFVRVTSSQGACSNAAGQVVCRLGALSNSASAFVTIEGAATSAGAASVSTAVSADVRDSFQSNNSATASTTVSGLADLQLALSDSPAPVFINNTITYTLSISNAGPNTAQGVTVSNTLPPGVTFLSATATQGSGCSLAGAIVTCSLGNLLFGNAASVTVRGTTPGAVGSLTNRAGVRAVSPLDADPANNFASIVSTNINPSYIIAAAGALLQAEASPPTGGIEAGETVTVELFLRNTGSSDTTQLTATLLASGGVTAPSGPQNYGALRASGNPAARLYSFTAAAASAGTVIATLQLNEGNINLGTVAFTFPLGSTTRFASAATISVPDNGKAAVYPAPMPVSGMSGAITKVSVTLSNVSHSYPDDLDVLLVSPAGHKAMLLSDVGGASSVTNLMITFDDTAGAALPDSSALTTGLFRVTNFDFNSDNFSPPAPAAPYGASLSAFHGVSPNGTWALYVHDDTFGDFGRIEGWSLTLTTVGRINPTPVRLLSPAILANGRISFGINGEAGASYVIQASPDMINWQPVATNTLSGATGSFDESRAGARRFYRVLRQQ